MGRTENNEGAKTVSELVDNIQNAVADCQVSGNTQTESGSNL